MAVVKVHNKSRGVTYVYESHSYWDKDLKQPRSTRKLIGKIDPDTGEIVPTGKQGRQKKVQTPEIDSGHSVTASKATVDHTAHLLKEKDEEIRALKQQVSSLERDIAKYMQLTQQAYAILGKAVSERR